MTTSTTDELVAEFREALDDNTDPEYLDTVVSEVAVATASLQGVYGKLDEFVTLLEKAADAARRLPRVSGDGPAINACDYEWGSASRPLDLSGRTTYDLQTAPEALRRLAESAASARAAYGRRLDDFAAAEGALRVIRGDSAGS